MKPDIPDDKQVISDDLYREIILDHYRHPRNASLLPEADVSVEGVNPLCGDQLKLTLGLKDGAIERIGFRGKGCAISQASTSMMVEAVEGKSLERAGQLARQFKDMMLENAPADGLADELEDLKALENVRHYPVRIKCAILAWNTLLQAIQEVRHG